MNAGPSIRFNKVNGASVSPPPNDKAREMERAIRELFEYLDLPGDRFDESACFDRILDYLWKHKRVLYSTISLIIYAYHDEEDAAPHIGNVLTNLDKMMAYADREANIAWKRQNLPEEKQGDLVDKTQKVIVKLWDHVCLAEHQYTMLKQTDDEYNEKFRARISEYQNKLMQEMNAQLITMVGIFTALSFLIFGSISSLDGIFENNDIPLLKTMSIGLVWGLCVLNMIFVFLFCVCRMTKLSFSANEEKGTTVFQRYPIVFWSNLLMVSLLACTVWGHFVLSTGVGDWMINGCVNNPGWSFWIISLVIAIAVFAAAVYLKRLTRRLPDKDSDDT